MNRDLLEILCCPACRGDLTLTGDTGTGPIESGTLRCGKCAGEYPIRNGIGRFVPAENYADNFGLQWNRFSKTQFDSHTGVPISRNRFFAATGWTAEELKGKRVLDVGCGSGRFAEVALSTGARLVALDYSNAVDACKTNLAGPNSDFLQADVYRLPFKPGVFDYVYCIGVLQNTPDPDAAFRALLGPLKVSGKVAGDIYPKTWMAVLWPKYWMRPITRRIRPEKLFGFVEGMVRTLLPVSRLLGRIPLLGRKLRWFVPVANYEGIYPLNDQQLREWAVLDTFDMLGPAHDHPRSRAELSEWISSAGLKNGEVLKVGHLVARGVKTRD